MTTQYALFCLDDDGGVEEEDSFMGFTGSKLLGDAAEENEDDQMNSDDDVDRGLTGHGVSANSALPHYSRQKLQDLRENYNGIFTELYNSSFSQTNPLSPKLRRSNHGTPIDPNSASDTTSSPLSHRDRIQRCCQETKNVGEFVKIAYPELADPNIETERKDLLANQESMR